VRDFLPGHGALVPLLRLLPGRAQEIKRHAHLPGAFDLGVDRVVDRPAQCAPPWATSAPRAASSDRTPATVRR
jgi:hypothetical protein